MSKSVHSVAKAVQILFAFDEESRVLTVRDIAKRTEIPRSTVHETVRTLVDYGVLETCAGGGVRLGATLAMLGGQVVERLGLVDRALQPIKRHLEVHGVQVDIAGHVPGAVYYAHRQMGRQRIDSVNRTGRRWPVYATGCGRAILASMSPEARESILPQTWDNLARRKLEIETAQYLKDGYLVTDVSESRIISIAAPVFDSNGNAIGAIGCGEFRELMSAPRIAELGVAVREAARETSRQLWAPDV